MIQVICRTCHGTGSLWTYENQTLMVCITCGGTGRLHRPEVDVLKDKVTGLTLERDRALALINELLYELKLRDEVVWDRCMGVLIDLNNDIYEREHPDVEVPW